MDTRMVDEDLKTMVREFRASVAADLEAAHRRIDELSDEVRRRIGTAETAILAEIRDQGGRLDRRLERVEARMGELDGSMDQLDTRMDQLDGRMDQLDGRMDQLESGSDAE